MTGRDILKQKWCLLNSEKLIVDSEIEELKEKLEYQDDKAQKLQGEMDSLMKEIKKLKE